jgi:hypothetical protein
MTGEEPLTAKPAVSATRYVFFGGRRRARFDETVQTIYNYFEDHLGSSRVIVQSTDFEEIKRPAKAEARGPGRPS